MAKKKTQSEPWRNRIVGYGEESPEDLLANPSNFRIHPKAQQDALRDVLNDVGIVDDVIVNRSTGFLVDGHLRVSLAMREGQPSIPVKYVDLSEHEESLILLTFDPLSAMAATDAEKLDELLRDTKTGSATIQAMLSEMATKNGLYQGDLLQYSLLDRGTDPREQFDAFQNATIRQVVLSYPLKGNSTLVDGYEWAIMWMDTICEDFGLQTHTDAVTHLLAAYASTCDGEDEQ